MRIVVKRRTAFTLVELLVVMGVIVLLAALTLPSIKTLLAGQKITQAARVVQAHIDAARGRAISSGSLVAVLFERQANQSNSVTRLSVGQVFPPYQGDVVGAVGALANVRGWNSSTKKFDATPDLFCDQLTVSNLNGQLLFVTPQIFGAGDFIQLGDRENIFLIDGVNSTTGVISFRNPPFHIVDEGLPTEQHYPIQEGQILPTVGSEVSFRLFRKPTKSFAAASVLPRGTCVDLSVSGTGAAGFEFNSALSDSVMVVFNERGDVAFVMANTGTAVTLLPPSGVLHFLVGKSEQVSPALPGILSVKSDADPASVNANLNDKENVWVSINPYSGSVYSSSVQAGFESGINGVDDNGDGNADEPVELIPTRLKTARAFATGATTRSVD